MGGTRPLPRGENEDGSGQMASEAARSWRPARRRRVDDMDQPVSLEKLRGLEGTIGGGHDMEWEGQVHVA